MRIPLQMLALVLIAAPAWSANHQPPQVPSPQEPHSVDEIAALAAAKTKATPAIYEYAHALDMWILTVKPIQIANPDASDMKPSERNHLGRVKAFNKEIDAGRMAVEEREAAMIKGSIDAGLIAGQAEGNVIQILQTFYRIDDQRLPDETRKKPIATAAPKPVEAADPSAPPAPKVEVRIIHKGETVDP